MTAPQIQSLKFIVHDNQIPWKETKLWAIRNTPNDFRLVRTEPDEETSSIDVSDVKEWFLKDLDGKQNRMK